MGKAEQAAGGAVVNAIAYQTEFLAAAKSAR
jgi:hypothetical protein